MKNLVIMLAFVLGCASEGGEGSDGTDGLVGPQGPKGEKGDQGEIGPQGSSGPQGPAGPQGAVGPAGATGAQGNTGAQGPAGPMGATGSPGAPGLTGPAGAQGPQGPQGQAGATGQQGPQGPRGLTGPAGVAGPSPTVLSNAGQQFGYFVPWRDNVSGVGIAVLMHQENPGATFPQGYVIPESPTTFFYLGSGCSGSPMTQKNQDLYADSLFWVTGNAILWKKTGSTPSIVAGSQRGPSGGCVNGSSSQQSFSTLADSGFRLPGNEQMENTKPWTVAVQ